ALRLCLAFQCDIDNELVFSRKSYFYPDLAKNYQISQFERPLGRTGKITLSSGKQVGITRVHIEEDPASLIHESKYVLVDYNRSGNPLCEIVTEPEMESPEQAREFMKKLQTMLNYLGIFHHQHCVIKADANISIKQSGYVRSEIKNVTGFKEIERALFYEVDRQKKAAAAGEPFVQDTRGWDAEKGITYRMRTKETEADYGYILDTDLVPIGITSQMVAKAMHSMPELAEAKKKKFIAHHKIAELDAEVLSQEKRLAELFEKVAEEVDPVLAAKWLRRELVRVMNYNKQTFDGLLLDENHMIELLSMVEKKEITDQVAQKILEELIVKPFSPRRYVAEKGLHAVSDTGELEKICRDVVFKNPTAVKEFKAGKEKSFQFLVGQVMKATQGKADPAMVNELLGRMM
ncbi:Asp-tRNA(Asn)/Glu-tRNA(Gln) amidotransferase subunit GatB, partial [Candidatus Woesearchaeota archaeon]|nr:Asp-tRNA(Asn)/Glu-tRNA(Gln) amidotransferase subunit GatB [Candidatus Woesearchaeota archaeon]